MSKRETTSEGFTLEQLLDFKKVPELKAIALLLGYTFKSGATKDIIIINIARILREEPMLLIKACYLYELEMFKDIIEGKMSVEYAEKSGILFDYNRFGLVYALENKKTKVETLHFQKELGEILLPLIESEIAHRKTIGGDLVEKAVIGSANVHGYTDLYSVLGIVNKVEGRLKHKFNQDTFTDAISPFYSQSFTKKDNSNPILSPFAARMGFYPDEDHLTEEEPKEYDLDTYLSFGEMPYPHIAIKEAETLEKLLQKYGNPSEGTPREMMRELWLEKQDMSQWNRFPDFGKYFLFTNEDDINKCLKAFTEFLNSVPCWKFNGRSSKDLMKKEANNGKFRGKMPKITMGPNMRAMGIESFEQLEEMAKRGEELPDFPELPTSSSVKSQTRPSSSLRSTTPSKSPNPIFPSNSKKVGRNEPCPCGSGKKYKNCCGR